MELVQILDFLKALLQLATMARIWRFPEHTHRGRTAAVQVRKKPVDYLRGGRVNAVATLLFLHGT